MFDASSLAIFLLAGLVLVMVPGPAVLFIIARSIEQGRLAGIVSSLGVASGGVMHVVFAAVGLSAVLLQSALAFSLVKLIGAGYLIYLGLSTLLAKKSKKIDLKHIPILSHKKLFMQGFMVNLMNPKTALFFMAFLPQFVDPSKQMVALQIVTLGAMFIVIALLSDMAYAVCAGSIKIWVSQSNRFERIQKYLIGSIYIGLGCFTGLTERPK